MTDEEWDALEQAAWDAGDWAPRVWSSEWEARRVNRARVAHYTRAVCNLAIKAEADVQKAVAALERARRRAEKAVEYRNRMLAHAEATARCYSAADPEWDAEVASCLEELIG